MSTIKFRLAKPSVKQKINIFLSLSFIIVLSIGIITYINTQDLITISKAVTVKIQKIQLRAQLLDELVNAETAQRGFIITDEGDYLIPYANSINAYPKTMKTLLKLSSSPAETSLLHIMNDLAQQKLTELDTTMNLRKTKGFDAAALIIKGNTGKDYLDQIRNINEQFQITDQQELATLTKKDSVARGIGFYTIIFGTFIGLVLVAISLIFINKKEEVRISEPHKNLL